MVKTTIAGSTSYGITLSDAIASGAPDGNCVYLAAEKAKQMRQFLQKINQTANDYSYSTKDGKKKRQITIPKSIVVDTTGGRTNTAELNAQVEQLEKWHDMGDASIYMWIYNFVDSDYVALGYVSGAAVDYLKGAITNLEIEMEHGNIYYVNNIQFVGVT
jgi:hypothetical protein